MNSEVLDMEIVRALRQQAPTTEDLTALKEFDGDHTKLGKVGECPGVVLTCKRIHEFFR